MCVDWKGADGKHGRAGRRPGTKTGMATLNPILHTQTPVTCKGEQRRGAMGYQGMRSRCACMLHQPHASNRAMCKNRHPPPASPGMQLPTARLAVPHAPSLGRLHGVALFSSRAPLEQSNGRYHGSMRGASHPVVQTFRCQPGTRAKCLPPSRPISCLPRSVMSRSSSALAMWIPGPPSGSGATP